METYLVECRLFWMYSPSEIIDAKTKDSTQKTLIDLTCGTVGGTFGTILNTPFDVVKSRIQAGSTQYRWTYPSILKVAREEGLVHCTKVFIQKF